jgi:hypothetical protein
VYSIIILRHTFPAVGDLMCNVILLVRILADEIEIENRCTTLDKACIHGIALPVVDLEELKCKNE